MGNHEPPIRAGMAVECRVALTGEWIPGEAHSGVEGTHKDGRKIHDFPVIWVWVAGVDGPMPWPAEDVRLPNGVQEGGDTNE